MKSVEFIKQAIEEHIKGTMGSENPRYSLWYCGITNDEKRRKAERKAQNTVNHWKSWRANSMKCANKIEQFFREEKGTSNFSQSGGAKQNSDIVYICRLLPKREVIPQQGLGDFTSLNDEEYSETIGKFLFS